MPSISHSDREAIVSLCITHETDRLKPNFRRCVVSKPYFIKYGDHSSLYYQCETQKYIYNKTVGDPIAPRVPKVVDYFTSETGMSYFVMEYIDATTPPDNAHAEVADALRWLRNVPPPPGLAIGSVGGGPVRHSLFQDFEAPLSFSDKCALQNYFNKALERIPPRPRPAKIDFSNDEVIFTQSDMDKNNFFLDENGKMCMLDFESIVLLPESFASYTMNAYMNPFIEKVAEYLQWPSSPNGYSMARAGAILCTMGDTTLDKDGLRKV